MAGASHKDTKTQRRSLVGRGSGVPERGRSAESHFIDICHPTPEAAEPGVAPATARQLLVGARHIPTKRHLTLRSPPVFWGPRPTKLPLCAFVSLCETLFTPSSITMQIRDKEPADQAWIESVLDERWGASGTGIIIVHNEVFDARTLPALIAGERDGLAIYKIGSTDTVASADLISLDAITPGQGVGTALIEGLIAKLKEHGVERLRVTTTNDNLDALRFYQRRGFRIVAVHPGAVDEARKIKPTISLIGEYGIPIRDEIELEVRLEP